MTKKQLLESKIFQDLPDDTELWVNSSCFYRKVEFIEVRPLWINSEKKEVVALHLAGKGYGIG